MCFDRTVYLPGTWAAGFDRKGSLVCVKSSFAAIEQTCRSWQCGVIEVETGKADGGDSPSAPSTCPLVLFLAGDGT